MDSAHTTEGVGWMSVSARAFVCGGNTTAGYFSSGPGTGGRGGTGGGRNNRRKNKVGNGGTASSPYLLPAALMGPSSIMPYHLTAVSSQALTPLKSAMLTQSPLYGPP